MKNFQSNVESDRMYTFTSFFRKKKKKVHNNALIFVHHVSIGLVIVHLHTPASSVIVMHLVLFFCHFIGFVDFASERV